MIEALPLVPLAKVQQILEAALMSQQSPMTINQLAKLFDDEERPNNQTLKLALENLQQACVERGVELKEVANGYRYQAKQEFAAYLGKLWEEKPPRYSRAFLETLALIAYRQPITRAEIEDIRGVTVSSNIIRTLIERGWVEEIGHRDVPGRPTLLGTTKTFLDYFNLKALSELPSLQELEDLDLAGSELEKQMELLFAEQKQALIDADNAAADIIEEEIERYPIEMIDETEIELEIAALENKALAQTTELFEASEEAELVTEELTEEATDLVHNCH